MATAVVIIQRYTGAAAGTPADITSTTTRMKQADNGTIDTNNPVPAVTTSLSCWVSTRLNATGAPNNGIASIKWYSDGVSAGTGLTVKAAKASTGTYSGYRPANTTPAALVSGGAGEMTNTNHTGLDVASGTDAATYVLAGSAWLSVTGSIGAATGAFGDFVVYQLFVTASAAPGPMTARTYTWQYDET